MSLQYIIKSKVVSLHDRMEILDANENLVYTVERKFPSITRQTDIKDLDGKEIAHIHFKPTSMHPVYFIEMDDGANVELDEKPWHINDIVEIPAFGWEMRSNNALEFEFEIKDAAGTSIAIAQRKLNSIHQIYNIEIIDESQKERCLALFVTMKMLYEMKNEEGA